MFRDRAFLCDLDEGTWVDWSGTLPLPSSKGPFDGFHIGQIFDKYDSIVVVIRSDGQIYHFSPHARVTVVND